MWYDAALQRLKPGQQYSHSELLNLLQKQRPDMSAQSMQWVMSSLLKNRQLDHPGYNQYSRPGKMPEITYHPEYSELAKELISRISNEYSAVQFTLFETIQLNEFLNHLISQNTIFLQVDPDVQEFVFLYLRECGYSNIMIKPDLDSFHRYWGQNCIVIHNLLSEAPLNKDNPHEITLEKMLVDITSDKLLMSSYDYSEYPSILKQAISQYQINQPRMLRYARRRSKEEILSGILKQTVESQ